MVFIDRSQQLCSRYISHFLIVLLHLLIGSQAPKLGIHVIIFIGNNNQDGLQHLIIMKLFKSLFRFCSNTTPTKELTRNNYFTEIEAKEMVEKPNQLREMMLQHIDQFGEMSVDRYWKLSLTDPQFGYYANRNVFSQQGDFTTSPEISPLFGEMFGVWIAYFLRKLNIFDQGTQQVLRKFRIVELGGGRGFFIKDIVRALSDLKISNNFDITFIEVSEYNRKAQQDSIMNQFKQKNHFFKFEHQIANSNFEQFTSQNPDKNVNLTWVQTVQELFHMDTEKSKKGEEVPITIFVMNQFMDAMPISILKYTQLGWREKVLTKSDKPSLHFQLKTSERELPQKLIPIAENVKVGEEVEISPISMLTMDLLSKTIEKYGGAILNVDYGDEGAFSDSIRAIKDHKYIPSPYFWQIPGECDLSAYVNFSSLASFAEKSNGIIAYEAIPQGYFLEAMGIVARVDLLKQNMKDQQKKRIDSEYERLVSPQEMGEIYKVQIITKKQYGEIYPHTEQNQHSY